MDGHTLADQASHFPECSTLTILPVRRPFGVLDALLLLGPTPPVGAMEVAMQAPPAPTPDCTMDIDRNIYNSGAAPFESEAREATAPSVPGVTSTSPARPGAFVARSRPTFRGMYGIGA